MIKISVHLAFRHSSMLNQYKMNACQKAKNNEKENASQLIFNFPASKSIFKQKYVRRVRCVRDILKI